MLTDLNKVFTGEKKFLTDLSEVKRFKALIFHLTCDHYFMLMYVSSSRASLYITSLSKQSKTEEAPLNAETNNSLGCGHNRMRDSCSNWDPS